MANGLTIDKLYEAFMDLDTEDETPFAQDVFGFFDVGDKLTDKGWTSDKWASEYGMYLPTFDPSQIYLAERERDLDYRSAMDTLQTTQAATDRVYTTELDTLSTSLGREIGKGREVAAGIGLRSGALEGAMREAIDVAGGKSKDLGDRFKISETEVKDKYNVAMVDAAIDYDKTVEQEKEEFYDRTMAAIMRLMDKGAFDCPTAGEIWCEKLQGCFSPEVCAEGYCGLGTPFQCSDGSCVNSECDCPEMADDPICLSTPGETDQPTTDPGDTEGFSCADKCGGAMGGPAIGEGMIGGGGDFAGMSCPDACASMGGPTYFDPSVIEWKDRVELENEMGCVPEWNFQSESWQCPPEGGDSYGDAWCQPDTSWCCTGGPGGGPCDTLACLAGNPGCRGKVCGNKHVVSGEPC